MEKLTSLNKHLAKNRGPKGSKNRVKFDADSLAFRIGIMLQEARKEAKLTQEQLAEKTGTKKSYRVTHLVRKILSLNKSLVD